MRCLSVGNSGKPYRTGLCRKENPINQPSISDADINKALCRAHTVWWGPSFLPFFSALLPEVSASSFIYHLKVSSTLCSKMVASTCGDHVLPYSHRTEKESVLVSEFLANVLWFILTSLTLVTCPPRKQSLWWMGSVSLAHSCVPSLKMGALSLNHSDPQMTNGYGDDDQLMSTTMATPNL